MTPHLAAAARRAPLLRPAGTCGATPERSTAPSALGGSAPTGGGGTCLPPRRRCEWFVPPLPLSLPAAGGGAFPSWRSMRNCSSGAERLGTAAEQVSGRGAAELRSAGVCGRSSEAGAQTGRAPPRVLHPGPPSAAARPPPARPGAAVMLGGRRALPRGAAGRGTGAGCGCGCERRGRGRRWL